MKIHFNIDGYHTQRGLSLSDYYDTSSELNEVTCIMCRNKWKRLKQRWELEQEVEQRLQRIEKRIEEKRQKNIEYIKKLRMKNGDF